MDKTLSSANINNDITPHNSNKYLEYRDFFYSIELDENHQYIASVYGMPNLYSGKHSEINSCINSINAEIKRYIFEQKIQLLNYPRPIPDGLSLFEETVKSSSKYQFISTTTISLRNAFRKITEENIKIFNENYAKITLDDLDNVLENGPIYTYSHGKTIIKLINGLSLYDYDSGRQINLKEIFKNWKNPSDLFCIYIPNNDIANLEIESDHREIEHYPCLKSNTYKFIFKPSSSQETISLPIKITTNSNIIKRTYLTISKINTDTYSYSFKGSDDFNTRNGSTHLCAKKNFTDNLASVFPESISDFQPQRFELFIFEFSKFLQYAIHTNYSDKALSDYIKLNHPITQNCYNLLILKSDLENNIYEQQDPKNPFIETVLQTLNLINAKKNVSKYDFSILKEALEKSKELNFNEEMINNIHINCWEYILATSDKKMLARIVLLKIRDKLTNKQIFKKICPEKKYFALVKRELNLQAESYEEIGEYTPQLIQSRYEKIYLLAESYDLVKPNLSVYKNKKEK